MDAATLARCTGATLANAQVFADPLTQAMVRFHISTVRDQAAFLATIAIESDNLTKTEEDLYYRDHPGAPAAVRLASLYPRAFKNAVVAEPYVRNPEALGELLYQGYWGRGLIQLTWMKSYKAAGDELGFDYVNHPELVKEPLHAALTAGWFWDTNNCSAVANAGDMRGVTLRVNGPALLRLADRKSQYVKNVAALS